MKRRPFFIHTETNDSRFFGEAGIWKILLRITPPVMLALTRQIFCLVPIFRLLSLIGLGWVWLAFPLSETISGGLGIHLYRRQVKEWEKSIA